ncbi:unnamed protein product, partial [Nesidiocoris tenuis]
MEKRTWSIRCFVGQYLYDWWKSDSHETSAAPVEIGYVKFTRAFFGEWVRYHPNRLKRCGFLQWMRGDS